MLNPVGGAPGVLIELDAGQLERLDGLGPATFEIPPQGGTARTGEARRSTEEPRREADRTVASSGPPVVSIVSLPGVPSELKGIVDESLDDVLARIFGDAVFEERSLLVATQDESAIADVLAEVEQAHPRVYIKSRAQRIGSDRVNRITAAARGADADAVDALLTPVIADLRRGIAAAGFETEVETQTR